MDLHRRAASPQIAKLQQIPLETVPFSRGTIRIFFSLEPWSRFNIYLMSRVYDLSGKQVYRITLESADFDQPNFAKEHPDLAAKGVRMFSLDGYGPDIQLANGQTTQNHSTFGFYSGRPEYDTYRARVLEIAEGKAAPDEPDNSRDAALSRGPVTWHRIAIQSRMGPRPPVVKSCT